MVARPLDAPHGPAHPGVHELGLQFLAEQNVVDAQACIARPTISAVVPEGEHRLSGVQVAERVGPSLFEQSDVGLTRRGLKQRVVQLTACRVDVEITGHDVEVARQDDRVSSVPESIGMPDESFELCQLVVELRTGAGVAVREINAGNDDTLNSRLDVASMRVLGIARQSSAYFEGCIASREQRDAVLLSDDQTAVTRRFEFRSRELGTRGLELL